MGKCRYCERGNAIELLLDVGKTADDFSGWRVLINPQGQCLDIIHYVDNVSIDPQSIGIGYCPMCGRSLTE